MCFYVLCGSCCALLPPLRRLEFVLGTPDHHRERHLGCFVCGVVEKEGRNEIPQVPAAGLELRRELGHQFGTLIHIFVVDHPQPAPRNIVCVVRMSEHLFVACEDRWCKFIAPLLENGLEVTLDEPVLEDGRTLRDIGKSDNPTTLGGEWAELGVAGYAVASGGTSAVDSRKRVHCCEHEWNTQ